MPSDDHSPDNEIRSVRKMLVPLLLAFAVTGWLTGWLAGASSAPVVTALLPLLFGLLGAISYNFIDRQVTQNRLLEKLKSLELPDDAKATFRAHLDLQPSSQSLPAFWSVGVIIFCTACYFAIDFGYAWRAKKYDTVDKTLLAAGARLDTMTPEDLAQLQNLSWRLQTQYLDQSDIDSVFTSIVVPALDQRVSRKEINDAVFSTRDTIRKFVIETADEDIDSRRNIYDIIRDFENRDNEPELLSDLKAIHRRLGEIDRHDPLPSVIDKLLKDLGSIDNLDKGNGIRRLPRLGRP